MLSFPYINPDAAYWKQRGTSPSEIWYCAGMVSSGAMGTGAIANTLLAVPFISGKGGRIDRISFEVVGGSAGALGRVGIYSSTTDDNIYPDKLLVDGGEFSCASGGKKITTVDVELIANKVYWAVYLSNSGVASHRRPGTGNNNVLMDSLSTMGGSVGLAIRSALAYQALPSTFPSGGTIVAGLSGVFYRLAK